MASIIWLWLFIYFHQSYNHPQYCEHIYCYCNFLWNCQESCLAFVRHKQEDQSVGQIGPSGKPILLNIKARVQASLQYLENRENLVGPSPTQLTIPILQKYNFFNFIFPIFWPAKNEKLKGYQWFFFLKKNTKKISTYHAFT